MPRIISTEDDPHPLGFIDSSLLPDGEVVDQLEAPIGASVGTLPVLEDLASILDPHAPAPTPTEKGSVNGTHGS